MDFSKNPLRNPAYAALKSIPLSSSPNSLSPSPSTSSYTLSLPSVGRETHHLEPSHTPSPPLLHPRSVSLSLILCRCLPLPHLPLAKKPTIRDPSPPPALSPSLILCSYLPLPLPRLLLAEKPTIHGRRTLPLPRCTLSLPLLTTKKPTIRGYRTLPLPLLTIEKPTIRGYRTVSLPLPLPLSHSVSVALHNHQF